VTRIKQSRIRDSSHIVHPRQHLRNFTGALQADAYAGFHHLYGNDIYEAACWAHARRKFHDIHLMHASPTTTEALARIGALYAIEDEIRGKPVDVRLSVRQTRASQASRSRERTLPMC